MASNYNIMANYIVSKYIERVSGKDLGETFVDDDPSKRVMVGMLSEDRVEANIVNFKRIKKFSKSTSNFNKINFVIKTYRLDSYFLSYYPKDI